MFVVTLDQPRLQGKKEGWVEGRRKERRKVLPLAKEVQAVEGNSLFVCGAELLIVALALLHTWAALMGSSGLLY